MLVNLQMSRRVPGLNLQLLSFSFCLQLTGLEQWAMTHVQEQRNQFNIFLIFFLMVTGSQKVHWSLVVSHFQGIEQLKKEERRWAKKTKWMNMRAVFGHPFSILWFSPFSTPDHGKAETYQYVVWELSAGNKADRSKVKAGRWVQPQKAMPNTINTPMLAMDSPPSASCVVN